MPLRGARRGPRGYDEELRRARELLERGAVLALRVLLQVFELGADLHRAALDFLRRRRHAEHRQARGVRELRDLLAQRLEAVLHLEARDDLAIELHLALELVQREG